MDLVVDQVMELQHVDVAHGHLAVELVAGAAVVQVRLARRVETRQRQHVRHIGFLRAVEHRRRERHADLQVRREFDDAVGIACLDVGPIFGAIDMLQRFLDGFGHLAAGRVGIGVAPILQRLRHLPPEAARGPAEVRFEDLPDVHARRHAQRVEHDVDRRPVFEERHVLVRQDAADDALVAVTAGHLVARLQLALDGDEDLDHLEHARRQFVAALQLLDAVFIFRVDPLDRVVILRLDRFQCGLGIVLDHRELPPIGAVEVDQHLLGDLVALLQALRHRAGRLTDQQVLEAGEGRTVEDRALVVGVLLQALDFLAFDRDRALVLVDTVAVEDADLDDRA